MMTKRLIADLALEKIIPRLSALNKTNKELDNVERYVGHNTVKPDNSSPAPSNTPDVGKSPNSINCDYCGHL
jgi:hypothetical protein